MSRPLNSQLFDLIEETGDHLFDLNQNLKSFNFALTEAKNNNDFSILERLLNKYENNYPLIAENLGIMSRLLRKEIK